MNPVDLKNDLPAHPSIPQESTSKQNLRIQRAAKIVLCLLAGALALGVLALASYTLGYPLVIGLMAGAVALTVLGLLKAINTVAHRLPKPVEKAIHLIHAIVTEIFAVFTVILLYPLQGLFKKKITEKNPDERPILLVHGYLHNGSGWVYMMNRLKHAGFKSVYTVSLWHPFRSIDEYAEEIKLKAEQIQKETGRDDLMIVGHSMGGLVGSKAAANMGNKVTHVVTLGSPLKGTPVSILGVGPNVREMGVNSLFVQDLKEKIKEQSAKTLFFEVASTGDGIVPAKYALLGQPKDQQMVLDDIGHMGMLFSPEVADQTIDWLKNYRIETSSPTTKI